MPGYFSSEYDNTAFKLKQKAESEVRRKFPHLIEGSSGWYRAVENRRKRVKL